MQGARPLFDQKLQRTVSLAQIGQRIDLTLLGLLIRNRYSAVHNLPVRAFKAKHQNQPCHLAGKTLDLNRKVDMKEGRCHNHIVADVLQRQVQHLDTDSPRNLRKVLPGNLDPIIPVLDQDIPAAGIATEVVTEMGRQTVIARSVHLDVLLEQRTNLPLAVGVRGTSIHVRPLWKNSHWLCEQMQALRAINR